jgi:peptidoglycan hydrolase-like protein with peptidoglycan-binding domain
MRKPAATTLTARVLALALPLVAAFPATAQQAGTTPAQTQPSAGPGAGAIDLSPDQIRQLQQALNENGFNAGEVDGVFGARTREALKRFQTQAGLPPTGELDAQTLTAVGHGDKVGATGAGGPSSVGQTSGQGETSQQPAESPKAPNRQ